jgi:hypothetical protein
MKRGFITSTIFYGLLLRIGHKVILPATPIRRRRSGVLLRIGHNVFLCLAMPWQTSGDGSLRIGYNVTLSATSFPTPSLR